jgi:CDP-glucose 4,6-dehydratase
VSSFTPGDYRGVRALITGHTGFKGAWLSEWLLAEGAHVGGLALDPDRPSLFHDLGLGARMHSVIADIRDLGAVEQALGQFAPDIIFHLAAQALVRDSYADPVATFAANVAGTVHVLDAARRCPSVRAIVCVTSDKCYDNREQIWGYREIDALGGRDPYSASKAAAEIVAASYRDALYPLEGRIRLASARAGNVIGGGDWSKDRLVPDLVRALSAGRRPVLRNPNALRPWQHVLEPLCGYLVLGQKLLAGEPVIGAWNFGPERENEVTVAGLVERFAAAWGVRADFEVEPATLPEAQTLRLDISKAHALLGWRPLFGVEETVQLTVDWYRQRAEAPEQAADRTRAQIAAYRSALRFGG